MAEERKELQRDYATFKRTVDDLKREHVVLNRAHARCSLVGSASYDRSVAGRNRARSSPQGGGRPVLRLRTVHRRPQHHLKGTAR